VGLPGALPGADEVQEAGTNGGPKLSLDFKILEINRKTNLCRFSF
jgi:hypothetical protein